MFELLFKYSSYVFDQGNFVFAAGWPARIAALLLAAVAIPVVLGYFGVRGKSGKVDRGILVALRLGILAVMVVLLLQPSLVVETAVPQENFVGVVIDDSRSMRITDFGGEGMSPRSDFIAETFGDPDSDLMQALSERFKLRFFRFSDFAERTESLDTLAYAGEQTRIGPALDFAHQELAAVPLSGLVLVTDGADNSLEGVSASLQSLRANAVPVFPVGIGAERFDRDIEVASVEAPRTVLSGSQIAADVVIEHKGFEGQTVLLLVEGPEGVVGTQEIELPLQGDSTVAKAQFTAKGQGPHLFSFRIAVQDGEMVRDNNQQDVLIVVQDHKDKILYIEGSPSYRIGKLRSFAIDADPNLMMGVFLRMAENKFYRVGFEDPEELAGGFPTTREELFKYKALIVGSWEADFFTPDQQQMMHDFVSQRGGGFLMMGGYQSFGEGGWADTPVADILPIELVPPFAGEDDSAYHDLNIRPTLFGRTHPVTQMADTVEMSLRHWETLPPLGVLNVIGPAKPGAVTVLEGTPVDGGEPEPVLAYQRFGRGKALAFTPVNPWYWQMAYEIPLEDQTHETFFQQLFRWLVNDVPGQVAASTLADRFAPGTPVRIDATVLDDNFIEVNNAAVSAVITAPSGNSRELPLDWSIDTDGEYSATFIPDEEGFHSIHVTAARAGEPLGEDTTYVDVAELSTEAFAAERRTSLLERIAAETGGRWYTPQNLASLPDDLRYSEGGTTVLEVRDLWDMPIIFLLLVGLIGTEWGYRKWRGLA
ncbi:MAG: glutamine amidotransferase [Acidobacteriota bacterium]